MIGVFQVWHKGEDRPATGMKIYKLDALKKLYIRFNMNKEDGILWPDLHSSVVDFEIRKVDKE